MTATLNRRQVLQQVAWLMGGAISTPAIFGILNGCSAKPGTAAKLAFLTEEQGALVGEVAEIMIPRTDTPGAIDVGISTFIDAMLKDAYATEDQRRFVAGLTEFEALSRRKHGRAFLEIEPGQRKALVQSVHDSAVAEEVRLAVPPAQHRRPFILMTKELSLLGYFTSEAGATRVLQYVQVPGALRACIPVAEAGNGKTWATEMNGRF